MTDRLGPIPPPENGKDQYDESEYHNMFRGVIEDAARAKDSGETDWRKAIGRHPWIIVGVMSLGGGVIGVMSGRVTSIEAREHQELREDQRLTSQRIDGLSADVNVLKANFPLWQSNTQLALNAIRELQRENYEYYRAEAQKRGDTVTVNRLNKKLDAMKKEP